MSKNRILFASLLVVVFVISLGGFAFASNNWTNPGKGTYQVREGDNTSSHETVYRISMDLPQGNYSYLPAWLADQDFREHLYNYKGIEEVDIAGQHVIRGWWLNLNGCDATVDIAVYNVDFAALATIDENGLVIILAVNGDKNPDKWAVSLIEGTVGYGDDIVTITKPVYQYNDRYSDQTGCVEAEGGTREVILLLGSEDAAPFGVQEPGS